MMKLTQSNYYSREAAEAFMSYSQFSSFMRCEAAALAEIRGEYERKETAALLQGSYIDAYVEGRLDEFVEAHPDIISSRGPTKGELKSDFKHLDTVIQRFERDDFFKQYLNGQKQVIVTGEIGGVPWKGKIDILGDGRIVDFKAMANFGTIYDPDLGCRVSFPEFWMYAEQGAIYQELLRQTTGQVLPFFNAAVTKEDEPDLAIIEYPTPVLREKLRVIEQLAPRFHSIKMGIIEPQRCDHCEYCRSTKVLTGTVDFREVGLYE